MEKVYKKYCFECRACIQSCAKGAISMIENEEGFSYPIIDQGKCVDCGLCNKVCPANHVGELKQKHIKVIASRINDREILLESSSGGIFTLLAKFVLQKKGVVFGAAFDERMICRHICIDNEKDLSRLRGSKYVHSDIGTTYIEARKHLREGKWVYFTGTPCQIAGLKLFLRKTYETLLTSDFICHGTPSQKGFNFFVRGMENDLKEKVVKWSFRDKRIKGWSCSSSSSSSLDKKGKEHYHIANLNMTAYFQAFLQGHLFRMDCYSCPFAVPERVSDITIADYWQVYKYHDFKNITDGVSLVIINNSFGKQIWDVVCTKTTSYDSKMEYVLQTSNHNLYRSSKMPEERKDSYRLILNDYVGFCKRYMKFYTPTKLYIFYFLRNTAVGKIVYSLYKKIKK